MFFLFLTGAIMVACTVFGNKKMAYATWFCFLVMFLVFFDHHVTNALALSF
ncbi:DUF5993 family protein [Robbsia andropogonis]|uniref:DUF5993 family protein n=1 Tax=Robbsia andropogonis TaxID=28092 RepID=UPI000BB9FFDB